ncbi:MAG: site-specific DNA-methyltransferase, partial [Treponema sp.]|nr:site-specific DNA-methyltransferase [Treponema sp.]
MSINISKQKREDLLNKIEEIRKYLKSNLHNENAQNLMGYLNDLTTQINCQKYGLVFEEHKEAIDEKLENHLPVLTEEKDLFVGNGGEMNFLIEGDNLASLKLLEKTHKGKIDVIYIDPPYNTGSNDFAYDDNYVDKDDDFKHSKWLSFMNSRLKIAKTVLKDNGCILISINENEIFGLKLLCDEIFGTDNYLTTFAVKVRHENRILKGDKDFHEVFEYLLFYRKSEKHKTSKRIFDNTSNDEYVWTLKELEKPCEIVKMGNKEVSVFTPNQYLLQKAKPSVKNLKRISIRGSIKEGNSSGRFFMAHLDQYIGKKNGYVFKVNDMGDDGLGYRYFIIPENTNRKNGDYLQGVPQFRSDTKEVPYANLLDFEYAFNNVGYEGNVEFRNGKKPIDFLQHCFDMSGLTSGEKNVLDFFAGSGSTGHALLDYNAKKGTKHKFILCTNNENNICRDITYQRLKNVITKDGIPGSLKYFKVDFVEI